MDVSVGRESSGGSKRGGATAAALASGSAASNDWPVAVRAAVRADDLRRNSRRECGCNQRSGSGVTVAQCRAPGQNASSSHARFHSKGGRRCSFNLPLPVIDKGVPWRLTRTSCRLSVPARPDTDVTNTRNMSRLANCADTVCLETLHRTSRKPGARRSFT